MHTDPKPNSPHSVYRIYDVAGTLIYVGVTSRGHIRQLEHVNSQPWAWQIAETQWEHFGSRVEADRRERELITSQHPKHNKVHAREGEPERIEYRLRQEQYELLPQVRGSLREMEIDYSRFKKDFDHRFGVWEKIARRLLNALDGDEPLTEKQMANVRSLLASDTERRKSKRGQWKAAA